jgi:hypothetical protein
MTPILKLLLLLLLIIPSSSLQSCISLPSTCLCAQASVERERKKVSVRESALVSECESASECVRECARERERGSKSESEREEREREREK